MSSTGRVLADPRTDNVLTRAKTEDPNGYRDMYERIFKAVPSILKEKVIVKILPMIVYGWMPTILGKSEWDESIVNLLGCKPDKLLDKDLDILRHFVNDSFIGVSKLLHFPTPSTGRFGTPTSMPPSSMLRQGNQRAIFLNSSDPITIWSIAGRDSTHTKPPSVKCRRAAERKSVKLRSASFMSAGIWKTLLNNTDKWDAPLFGVTIWP